MITGQWSLDSLPIRQSKEFLRRLYQCEHLQESIRNFDFLSTGLKRQRDESMTLEKFLKIFWKKRHLRLQVNSPNQGEIRYCAAIEDNDVSRFAWIYYPLTEENYKCTKTLFQEAYNRDLETTPTLFETSKKREKRG